ncbi:hypothetical protein, partial [Hafnia paralvei]|uniref:hypothetical protein n=1 Tax=Hafnia paralvei TaxID=546367 RepID=UPI0028D8EA7C
SFTFILSFTWWIINKYPICIFMLMKLLGDNNAKNINGERRSSERDLLLLCWIYHTDSVVRDK